MLGDGVANVPGAKQDHMHISLSHTHPHSHVCMSKQIHTHTHTHTRMVPEAKSRSRTAKEESDVGSNTEIGAIIEVFGGLKL